MRQFSETQNALIFTVWCFQIQYQYLSYRGLEHYALRSASEKNGRLYSQIMSHSNKIYLD